MKSTRHRRLAWCLCVAGIAVCAAALLAGAFTAQTPLVDRFDEQAYSAALARRVASVADIVADYEWQQYLILPLAPPDPNVPFPMPGGTLPLEPNGFSEAFLDGLLPVVRNGITVYPITESSRFTFAAARGGGWYLDNLSITNNRPAGLYGGLQTIERVISSTDDDVEERRRDGRMDLTDVDLDLGHNTGSGGDTARIVGLRFTNLTVAATACVHVAYVQFSEMNLVNAARSNVCEVVVQVEATNSAAAFTSATSNVTSRTYLPVQLDWSLPGWRHLGQANTRHRTPNLAGPIRALVVRPDWSSGNASVLTFIPSYTGNRREAVSFDDDPSKAALLYIEWAAPLP